MDKLKMRSHDVTGSNIDKIARLFPHCVTERLGRDGKPELAVDFEKLEAELSSDILAEGEERYQFTWPGKRAANRLANTPTTKTLRPCREESVDFDNTRNLYIEGDNLDVLKALRETYLGKVKMIYIDPPYNTGNDFVYNDDFAQGKSEFEQNSGLFDEEGNQTIDPMQRNTESNGRFHSVWCSMIYSRLLISRCLLSDDGVIFISIDNKEFATMKMICDNVFGENSFVTVLHVQMSTVQGQKVRAAKAGNIVKNGEFVFVYSKNGNKAIGLRPLYDPVKYDNHYSKYMIRLSDGSYEEANLVDILADNSKIIAELKILGLIPQFGCKLASTSLQDYYECSPAVKEFINAHAENIIRVHDSIDIPTDFMKLMVVGRIYEYTADKRNYYVCKNAGNVVTQRISFGDKLKVADDFIGTYGPTTMRGDWWSGFYLDMGNVSKEGDVNYDNGKKPVRLIRQLIEFCTTDGDIIMDFFAGSSTTAHAVMKLCAEDGNNRNFIMIQIDDDLDKRLSHATTENKAALKQQIKFLDNINKPHRLVEIGKERIRRAGKKIKEENADKEGIDKLDTGFRVLKLDSSNMEDVYYTPREFDEQSLFNENVKPDRGSEDLLFQVMLDLGIELSAKIETRQIAGKNVCFVDGNYLIACFDRDVNESAITEVARLKPVYFVMRDASAANDNVIDNFEQIFRHYSPDTNRRIL